MGYLTPLSPHIPRKKGIIFILGPFLWFNGGFLSEDLKKTKEAIKEKGANWKADETSMSELTPEERKKRLGLLPSEDELEESRKKGLHKDSE
jgi:hypothetical protein